MADFGRYSLADMNWIYHTIKETKNEYHLWKCGNCQKIDKVADSSIWVELCIICYQDLPTV